MGRSQKGIAAVPGRLGERNISLSPTIVLAKLYFFFKSHVKLLFKSSAEKVSFQAKAGHTQACLAILNIFNLVLIAKKKNRATYHQQAEIMVGYTYQLHFLAGVKKLKLLKNLLLYSQHMCWDKDVYEESV